MTLIVGTVGAGANENAHARSLGSGGPMFQFQSSCGYFILKKESFTF